MSLVTIIIAAILSIPPLLLMVIIAPIIMILSIPSLWFLTPKPKSSSSNKNNKLKHVVITGGSSGIGLAIARECVQRGHSDYVTLIARDQSKLNHARDALLKEVKKDAKDVVIQAVSADVANAEKMIEVASQLCASPSSTDEKEEDGKIRAAGPPTLLFNCAGTAFPRVFSDCSPADHSRLMNINFCGTVHAIHAFLPFMKERQQQSNNSSTIVLTSSSAGQVGIYGLSSYSASKFALRGLAEGLDMELRSDEDCDVRVQMAFPPDTDTPGYKEENMNKPKACHLISETAGLFQPEEVGKRMLNEAMEANPNFTVYFGLEGWMLNTLTGGMSPVNKVLDAMCQVALMGLLRLVSLFYLADFRRIVDQCVRDEKPKGAGKKSD